LLSTSSNIVSDDCIFASELGDLGHAPLWATEAHAFTAHAKIGELTLEKDFLAGALSKAGLLSAKR